MTDRELLEAAAKGALIPGGWASKASSSTSTKNPRRVEGFFIPHKHGGYGKLWKPLEDDGDALRLAVRKRFHVNIFSACEGEFAAPGFVEIWYKGRELIHTEHVENEDYELAARRAIVCAAAALAEISSSGIAP